MAAYCTECGTKNDAKRTFCGECGVKLPESPQQAKQVQAAPKLSLPSWSQWSKRTKVILIASVSFVLLCLVLFQTGKYLTDQDRLISQFEKAIKTEDTAFLQAKLLTVTDGEKLNAEQAKDLIQYMNQDSTTLKRIMGSLKDKSNMLVVDDKQGKYANSLNNLVHLRQNGKSMLLFDRYEFVLKPVHITLNTNYPDAVISLNGNSIADHLIERDDNRMIIGPLIPGRYDVQGSIKTDYIQVSADNSIDAFKDVNKEFIFDIQTIRIVSPYPNTKLYANGTDTGVILNDEVTSFGPVTLDGTLELHGVAEAPNGELISDAVNVDGSSVRLVFSNYDDVISSVMADTNKFILSWYKVLNALDLSYLVHATENYNNALTNNLVDTKDYYGIEREFIKHIQYGIDSFDLRQVDGQWLASINIAVITTVEKYSDLKLQLRLIYSASEQQWQMDALFSTYDLHSTEVKEHSFDIADQEKNTPKAKVPLEADHLISNYLYALCDAINWGNFSYVEDELYPDSELYKSQKGLVERLYKDNVREEVISFKVHSSEPLNDGNDAYKIRVTETIRIDKESGAEDHTYEWWYYSKPYEKEQRLYKIEEAK